MNTNNPDEFPLADLKLQPENIIVLNAEDSKWFAEFLLNPKPNERLIKFMTEPSVLELPTVPKIN